MFSAGVGKDGNPRVAVSQCPSAILAQHPQEIALLSWVLRDSPIDGMSGGISGPPAWPYPGGSLRNPAQIVDRVDIVRTEMLHLKKPEPKRPKPENKPAMRRRRS